MNFALIMRSIILKILRCFLMEKQVSHIDLYFDDFTDAMRSSVVFLAVSILAFIIGYFAYGFILYSSC